MTRGRKPDSPETQDAKGAPGKRLSQKDRASVQSKKSPAAIVVGATRPPKWLKRSRKATEVWNELAPLLQKLNLLTDLDAIAFARYCRYVAEWIAADQAVQKEGTWFDTVGTNGEPTKKRHPAFQACLEIEKRLGEMEATFGARPDARYKIMRDQAAAHGLGSLPLWGGSSERASQPEEVEEQQPEAPQADAIGALKGFDSAPPRRLDS